MSAAKQNHIQKQKNVELSRSTNIKRVLPDLENAAGYFTPKPSRREAEMAHCAVLGYN